MTLKSLLLWALLIGESIGIALLTEALTGVMFFAVILFALIILEIVDRKLS